MTHLTIKEAIKIIERKTDQTLTRREIAQLWTMGELQVCFKPRTHNCYLGVISNHERLDLISEAKLIGIRDVDFKSELYLTPSYHHKRAVFDAIENNYKDPIEMQVVHKLSHKRNQLLLMQGVSDQYLYEIDSEYKNGWQMFDSPKYFLEFEREEGASASYTITADELLITRDSLNAYIAKTKAKPKKEIDKYSPGKTRERVEGLANYVLSKKGSGVVTKARLAAAIFEVIKDTDHITNLKGDGERKIRDWVTDLKEWGKPKRPTNEEAKQTKAFIEASFDQWKIDEINRRN
ncbi:hypothetical protein HLH14_04510 [Acinetobacter sp. ANC 4282]|uniref:hypothetical protein n=1 Tax=Acinetobacter terrae TaxID=2731247 RepID=UPI0014905222|nr:hypothetical protein [Acinetobacter terrae]NNH15280.1 hypothetical protein [Acinetobacter terrae]